MADDSDPTVDMFQRLIAELEKERNEWVQVRAEADEHLAEIARELDSLRGALVQFKSRRRLALSMPEAPPARTGEFSNVPLADACVAVLTEAGRPMRAGEIVQELLRRGSRTSSATPYNVIVTAMRRDKRLTNVRPGWWGLVGRGNSGH